MISTLVETPEDFFGVEAPLPFLIPYQLLVARAVAAALRDAQLSPPPPAALPRPWGRGSVTTCEI